MDVNGPVLSFLYVINIFKLKTCPVTFCVPHLWLTGIDAVFGRLPAEVVPALRKPTVLGCKVF